MQTQARMGQAAHFLEAQCLQNASPMRKWHSKVKIPSIFYYYSFSISVSVKRVRKLIDTHHKLSPMYRIYTMMLPFPFHWTRYHYLCSNQSANEERRVNERGWSLISDSDCIFATIRRTGDTKIPMMGTKQQQISSVVITALEDIPSPHLSPTSLH